MTENPDNIAAAMLRHVQRQTFLVFSEPFYGTPEQWIRAHRECSELPEYYATQAAEAAWFYRTHNPAPSVDIQECIADVISRRAVFTEAIRRVLDRIAAEHTEPAGPAPLEE